MLSRLNRLIEKDQSTNLLSKKTFFNPEIQTVLNNISFDSKNTDVLGSFGLKSQLYFSDIDCYEVVKSPLTKVSQKFRRIINNLMKDPNVFIGDIKLGFNEDLRIIDERAMVKNEKVYYYNYNKSLNKLNEIKKYLTKEEIRQASKLLVQNPTEKELLEIKKNLRFHIVRWKPFEVIRGFKMLRNRKRYTFLEALKSKSLFKLDIVKFLNDKFLDFSIIYDLRDSKGLKLNKVRFDVSTTLKQDIKTYLLKKDYYKVLKRKFSLLKYQYEFQNKKENKPKIVVLSKILNGNLGTIYQVISNIDNIIYLIDNFDNLDKERIRTNIQTIIGRLSFIYNNRFLREENDIVGDLLLTLTNKSIGNIGELLVDIYERLSKILNLEAKKYL